jgi:hypothetical protein
MSRVFAGFLVIASILFGQAPQISNWWLTAEPKKVLADPGFYEIGITQRMEILSQIDPKFAKLSFDRKDSIIWAAETANLPKAADSDDVDQSFRSHADQIGAKRRRALSV